MAAEAEMLAANVGADGPARAAGEAILEPSHLRRLQRHVAEVAVSPVVQGYLVDLARVTREHREVTLGLSPRGLLIWQRVAQARAHLRGRGFVIPDDIQHVAGPVLEVRLSGDFDRAARVIEEILAAVPVPVWGGGKKESRIGL